MHKYAWCACMCTRIFTKLFSEGTVWDRVAEFEPIFNYLIFTAAADSAEVVIMLKSCGLVRLFVARFRHFYKSISRPLIGRKYHCHWGRGRWAPWMQNIVETIHLNDLLDNATFPLYELSTKPLLKKSSKSSPTTIFPHYDNLCRAGSDCENA